MMMMMMMMMMTVQESGMRVLSSLMKPAFCVQFSAAACGHMTAAAALSCSKGMPALLPVFLVVSVIWKS